MRALIPFLFFLFLTTGVFATSIGNVPPLEERDLVVKPGLHREYDFPVGGAEQIEVVMPLPAALKDYITISDPAPKTGPRTVHVEIDFPKDVDVPPGVYIVYFYANEMPSGDAQISASVSVSAGFIIRSYSEEPLIEITDVQFPAVPNGTDGNFTVSLISRTKATIPGSRVQVQVLDEAGNALVTGEGSTGVIASGAEQKVTGKLDTSSLPGGVYQTNVIVTYGDRTATYNKSVLRIGTLTIDVDEYTKTLTFNQTNKFQFRLKSNWNKPLTRVSATVDLLGQTKRSAEQSIAPFSTGETAEVYFDRTELPAGQVNGTMTIIYQELSADPRMQDSVQTHTFVFPIHADIVLPPEPAKVEKRFELTTTHIVIGIAVLLLLVNVVVVYLLLRKPKQPATPSTPEVNR